MTLNKKLAHKTVKAHYIAYKSMDDIYLRIDDNRVNTVHLADSYKSFMEKVASFSSRGTKASGVSDQKSSSAKHFTTKKPTIRPPRHSKAVAQPMVTQADSSSSAREDDNEEYRPPGLGK